MKIGTWLLAMMEPLIARILLSLGFSVVTIVGVDSMVSAFKSTIVSNVSSLPADMLNISLYLGVGVGISLIFGAITTKLTLWAIQNATSMVGKSNG